ncbi:MULTISPECIES: LytTR family DNA-binding domain-containing protein [Virgibacillus]|uniref:LytR family transcriptional regulator n=1 Tax=Virgibacillus pantothenticus TaxID=1473 RepID=A0A0L0QS69_VIRPA|nr:MULTISPECIES: LytTR family DNA-binding domain-containing protein [Virgibacillus]API91966.1 LytR family transcriptional regulator [Virgibacillus sp. 6R]KNE21402.1 LytR family transcriptional regulator [Virgibacillus pantothenticus]MBS7430419.1 LytTR family transcriptional regulator DNA-binding domain-containing protein [Virgibacillus sp. 19R1-5]MBU8566357.1 LytTR family transcriptional regulator DNA-binding domain-containing protein [Virgibacillus pantothenticus]MBU8600227.1 LytTR family tra
MQRLTTSSLLDVIGELFSDEISIAVTSTTEYIYYRPSLRVDLKIRPGDPIKEGTLANKAIVTEQKVSEFIDRQVYGIPYHGMAVPFHYQNKLEGCVMAIYPALTEGKSVITVKTSDGWKPLSFSDVLYLEVKDRKTWVVTKEFTGIHRKALQEFEYMLPREYFIRCHRSFIVNVNHITHIYPDTHSTFLLAMDNGDQLPVSQSYSSYFRKLLGF